jgi:hypothetical protein
MSERKEERPRKRRDTGKPIINLKKKNKEDFLLYQV